MLMSEHSLCNLKEDRFNVTSNMIVYFNKTNPKIF